DDAALGIAQDDAPALAALDDLRMIESGIESEEGESEPTATELGSVASAGIAPDLSQDRLNLASEVDGNVRLRLRHRHRNRFADTIDGDRQHGLAVADGGQHALV